MADPVSTAVLGATVRQFIAGTVSELKHRRAFEDRKIRIVTDKQLREKSGSKTVEILSVVVGTIEDVLDTPTAFKLTGGEEYTVRRTHQRFASGEISTYEQQITSPRKCEKCIPLNIVEDFEFVSDAE